MDKSQEDFLKELLNDFKIEASEHYQAMIDGIIILEKDNDISVQQSTIEMIFREVHSLKGASRAVNLLDIEKLCMNLENIFNSLKKGEAKLFPPMIDVFYKATDLLSLLLNDVNQNKKDSGKYNLSQVIRDIEIIHKNGILYQKNQSKDTDKKTSPIQKIIEPTAEKARIEEIKNQQVKTKLGKKNTTVNLEHQTAPQQLENQTVRISTDKLNYLLQQSEELISIKTTFEYFSKEIQNMNYQYSLWNRKAIEKINLISNSIKEKEIQEYIAAEKDFRKKHEDELFIINNEMIQFKRVANRMVDELLHNIKTTLLFPFSSMLNIFPKIVRDLSKEYSKEISIDIVGDNIEIDRRILEEIKDPLIHLIRNCIDHGIESKSERKNKGKSINGKIEIKIIQNIDRKIELCIKDDGAGIDKSKIIESALKLGVIKPDEIKNLSDKEIHSLIFSSGISTSPFITDISGRGLGMAIVAEKASKLGGKIEMETKKDIGTSFNITLPQTLATFRGVLIKSSEQFFVLPSSAVETAIRIQPQDIKTVESKNTIFYKNESIALLNLSDILKISVSKNRRNADDYLQLLIISSAQNKIAIIIDEILGEQEGIVKDLGSQLQQINNIAGATILGNGKIVPILHPSDLINSASNTHNSIDFVQETKSTSKQQDRKHILVAEDSITIRTLLRNFIENAGFKVKIAIDGQEAYNFLQNDDFDLIVSDIEMPRMNGFELTSKVREDKKYSDIPVILVTALETDDDKQRGMEVGANAYIIKSDFEKSNLIETIERLI